jgi:soluble lytic murein transglycosylase-like protein
MSIDATATRIAQIQGMIGALGATAPPPVAPAGTSSAFSQQLAAASATAPASPSAPVAPTTSPAAGGAQFSTLIEAAASKYGVDPALLKGLIRQESNFNPTARSPAGAAGLTQLMPGTAAALGVTDPLDPAQSIDAGAHYLRQQLDAFGGDSSKALAAYNAGPGAVTRYGGVPPYAETQNYVRQVLSYAQEYRAGAVV